METGIEISQKQIATLKGKPAMQLIQCLIHNKSEALLILEDELTIQHSINNGTHLNKLSRTIEKKNAVKVISYLILRVSRQFNVGKNFTPDQASMLAFDILNKYPYESIEDIVLMLKYARQGKVGDGKAYNLDPQTVLHKWMPQFMEMKAEEMEHNHKKKQGELNGMANFNWKKEDVDKMKTSSANQTKTQGFGERLKEVIGTEKEKPEAKTNRKEYLQNMYYEARKMSTDKLRIYLSKMDVNHENKPGTIPYDQDIEEIINQELDRRTSKKK